MFRYLAHWTQVRMVFLVAGIAICASNEVQSGGPNTPFLCDSPKIDAMFNDTAGNLIIFQDDKYYNFTVDRVANDNGNTIASRWPSLPTYIDAAVRRANGKTYFFKDDKYWSYQDFQMDEGCPKLISKGFPGIPSHVDAALAWGNNTYFFKGSNYWKYNTYNFPPSTTSLPISEWAGVPNYIDAVIGLPDGNYYFFKEDKHYAFNTDTLQVDQAAFPKLTAGWFGCQNTSDTTYDDIE